MVNFELQLAVPGALSASLMAAAVSNLHLVHKAKFNGLKLQS